MLSKVAQTLSKALRTLRSAPDSPKQIALASRLGVKAPSLSKHLSDLDASTKTPSDEWIARFGKLASCSDEQIDELLIDAQIERTGSPDLKKRWKGVRARLLRPDALLSDAIPPLTTIRECLATFDSSLIDLIPQEVLQRATSALLHGGTLASASFQAIGTFRDTISRVAVPKSNSVRIPTMGELVDELGRRMRIRMLRPDKDFCEASEIGTRLLGLEGGTARYIPVLPGLIAVFVQIESGGQTRQHSHSGIEFVHALEGTVTMVFDGHSQYRLHGANNDMLIYDSDIPHHTLADERAKLIVAHFDPTLMRSWNKVVRIYAEMSK